MALRNGLVYRKVRLPGMQREEEKVMGSVPKHPRWVWTLQGNWYRRRDGRLVTIDRESGRHVLMKVRTWRDLDPKTGVKPRA